MRGLKCLVKGDIAKAIAVAPLAGAWIENVNIDTAQFVNGVAPLAGAWIENGTRSRRCATAGVAPLAGAWIEIPLIPMKHTSTGSRTPCGCVD